MHVGLRERFLAGLEPPLEQAFAGRSDLGQTLVRLRDEAQVTLGLDVDSELFADSLARTLEDIDGLDTLAVADLYLAAACGRGDQSAMQQFDKTCGPELDRAISRSPKLGWSKAEFRQHVYVRLFVGEPGRAPKILSYRGLGSLRGWVRVMASRLIIDLSRRRAEPRVGDDALLDRLEDTHDTELDYLRHAYGPQLRVAFEGAVAALTVRQRNLLRQRYLHEVPSDTLAKLYSVHRSTLYLWLDQARAALLEQARARLSAAVPGDRLESVVALLGSQLQVSVRRMLESKLEAEG